MGTRRSRHNKGRKPLYKEFRLVGTAAKLSTKTWRHDPNGFLDGYGARQLTVTAVERLSEEACAELFCALRWEHSGGKPECRDCGSLRSYKIAGRKVSRCADCAADTSWTAGTVFASHKMSFRAILLSLAYFVEDTSTFRASELSILTDATYKAAHACANRIRAYFAARDQAAQPARFEIDRPRYSSGRWLSTRTWWTDAERGALKLFASQSSDLEKAADALGRSPSSIAKYARDAGILLPADWKAVLRPGKARSQTDRYVPICYPYIRAERAEHHDIMEVNSLIPQGIAPHMRSDMCQEILLALLEKRVTMDELRGRKNNTTFFIKKFYRDNFEQSGHALSFDAPAGDDATFFDIASSISAKEWYFEQKSNELSAVAPTTTMYTAPTQIDEVYWKQLRDKQRRLHELAIRRNDERLMLSIEEIDRLLSGRELSVAAP